MLTTSGSADTLAVTNGWLSCPHCGRNHRLLRIDAETEARNLRVYCRTCRTETILDIDRGQSVKRQSP